MRLAEHLAVGDVCCAAFRPSCDMVCVHFRQFPYTRTVGVMTDGTKRTVGNFFLFGFLRLTRINALFGRLVKTTYLQQFGILTAAKDIFIDAFFVLYVVIFV